MRVLVERNVIELDPGPNGTLTNDITVEVRADAAGKLELGPLSLNVDLESAKQIIEVEVKVLGKTLDNNDRPVVRFTYRYEDQAQPRYFEIFTGNPAFLPQFQYRVHVVVKGTIFSKGMEWWGPWNDGAGNGPLMVSVPTPDEAVSTRRLTPREIASPEIPRTEPVVPPPGGPGTPPTGPGAPPAVRTTNGDPTVAGYVVAEAKSAPMGPPPLSPTTPKRANEEPDNAELQLLDGWATRN